MSLKERIFVNPFKVTKHGEDEQEIDENAIDPSSPALRQPPATRAELWSYYLYYNGDNGFTMFSYIPNILQYLAYKGGFYPNTPDVKGCDINDALTPCYISWNNGSLPVSSMVLYVQAISFSLQFLLFTTFGGLADYGRWNRWILLLATIIGCASQIVPIALVNDDGSHWGAMMAINIIALIAYGTSLVFYAAAFPTLSDNLPAVRYARANPRLNEDQKQVEVEKWRNHVSAISTSFSNVGFFVITAVLFGASYAPWPYYDFPEGTEPILGNAPIYNFIATVVCGGYWLLFALPYFVFVPRGRTGPPLPEGTNHLTVGWKSIFKALKEIRKLRYLFIYILSYFMFSDAVNTTNQMISIVQGQITSFSAMQVTMLNFASSITSIIGCLFFLWISKQFGIKTKHNLLIIITLSTVVPIWGCFGIGLDNFGIKTEWELWAFYVWSGLFTAPIWAWQQTMLAELTPKGQENLVFGLFGVINKASSWIGPVVIGAITEHTSNLWHGWPFIAALFVIAIFMIVFLVDVDKAKVELAVYEADLARRRGLDPESHEKCELPEAAQVEEAKTP